MRCGIFVGGRSRRMNGYPKALLRTADGETLLERTVRIVRAAGLDPVLVGDGARVDGVPTIDDARTGSGPLGGLTALLEESAIAIGCDMPAIEVEDLRALVSAKSDAAVLAPKHDGYWEPLFARYDARVRAVAARRLHEGQLALQGLIDEVGGETFDIAEEKLRDVDTIEEAERAGLVRIHSVDARGITEREDALAVEEPLEIRLVYGSTAKSLSITMRTPGDDVALALGFLVSEGIIRRAEDVAEAKNCGPTGNVVRVTLAHASLDLKRLERHFYTTSSCGICGKTSLEAVRAAAHDPIAAGPVVARSTIHVLPEALRKAQRTFAKTGGLHASGLFGTDGTLIVAKEDVGRHNALDKVVGDRLLAGALPLRDHILLVSGRASFELVQKAVMAGIPILAAVGAPSTLAVDLAREEGLTLLGFVRDERFNIYTGQERISS